MLDDPSGVFRILAPKKPRRDASHARLRAMARQLAASDGLSDWAEYSGDRALRPLLMGMARTSLTMADCMTLVEIVAAQDPDTPSE